jgi:hypothetical protein
MIWFGLYVAILGVGIAVAFLDWRKAVPWVIVAGVVQDPVRKLMPGAPAYMVLAFVPLWFVVVARALREPNGPWQRLGGTYPRLRAAIVLFLATLVPAALVVMRHGPSAWRLVVIGSLGYLLPVLALLVGYGYTPRAGAIRRLMAFYCLFTSVVLLGSLAEYVGVRGPALGTDVFGTHWIRHISAGHWVELMSGLFRSPDIMGWHAAAVVMMGLTLALDGRLRPRALWLVLAAWGAVCVLISGRNKMILMPAIWLVALLILGIRQGRTAVALRLAALAAAVVFLGSLATDRVGVDRDYLYNTQVTSSGVLERIERETATSLKWTYIQSGFWGDGLGIASQGRQHLGLKMKGGWQESGLSKILVELGVLGLLAGLVLAWAVVRATRRSLLGDATPSGDALLQSCIYAFVAANAACFLISHQAFSDGTLIVITGMMLGFGLSARRWAARTPPPATHRPSVRRMPAQSALRAP